MLSYGLVLFVGFIAGTVSGVVGTGATVILLPVLVMVFGPREAVPIMAVVALMSNFAKITAWWRHIDWRAAAAYAAGGIPTAALGARTLLALTNGSLLRWAIIRSGGAARWLANDLEEVLVGWRPLPPLRPRRR